MTLTYLNDSTKWIIGRNKDEKSNGSTVLRSFDVNGNLLSQSDNGVLRQFTYDAQGNIVSKTLPRGLVHTYGNYKLSIAQYEAQPESVTIVRSVDERGNIVQEIDGEQHSISYTYDNMNRVASITYPRGNAKVFTYTANSQTAKRGELVEETQYGEFGHVSSITLGGISSTYRHDAFGRIVFESNPGVTTGTNYSYDELGRIVLVTNADGTSRKVVYGPATASVTDERGFSSTYSYRAYGEPTSKFLMNISAPEAAASVTIERNASDLVISIKQDGVVRTFEYNDNKYLISETNPETGKTAYGRDAAGNMTSRNVGTSASTNFSYDGRNRLATVTYPGGDSAVTTTYNRIDKILTAVSSGGTRSYEYDVNGNVTKEILALDGQTYSLGYSYNDNDQLNSLLYPRSNQLVSYAPDVLGRPTQVSGYINQIAYWPSGQIAQIKYSNGMVSNYGQNTRLWASSFSTYKEYGQSYLNSTYQYDGIGNLATIIDAVDSSRNRTMDYDKINRLVGSAGPWGAGTIAYSGSGNILSQTLGAVKIGYAYVSNRLQSVSGSQNGTYAYDVYGNVAAGPGGNYIYDAMSNLKCVNCSVAAGKVEYAYDGLNKRSSVLKSGIKTYEMYDTNGNQIIEFTPQSNKLVEYIYLGGKRVAQRVSY